MTWWQSVRKEVAPRGFENQCDSAQGLSFPSPYWLPQQHSGSGCLCALLGSLNNLSIAPSSNFTHNILINSLRAEFIIRLLVPWRTLSFPYLYRQHLTHLVHTWSWIYSVSVAGGWVHKCGRSGPKCEEECERKRSKPN